MYNEVIIILASQSTIGTIQVQPVSLQWVQHGPGQSMYNGVIIRPASQSTMGTINDWPIWVAGLRWEIVKSGRGMRMIRMMGLTLKMKKGYSLIQFLFGFLM
jgi:hypothetical protein